MGEEITFENGRFSEFQGHMTLNLTCDRVILHTFMHHSSTSTYIPNFIEIEESLDRYLRPTLLGQLGGYDLKILFRQITRCLNIGARKTKVLQKVNRISYSRRWMVTSPTTLSNLTTKSRLLLRYDWSCISLELVQLSVSNLVGTLIHRTVPYRIVSYHGRGRASCKIKTRLQ